MTGRIHRTPRELQRELARYDRQLATLSAVLDLFAGEIGGGGLVEEVRDAWNAVHDAIRVLAHERSEVEANYLPIPPEEAGTYRLIQLNID